MPLPTIIAASIATIFLIVMLWDKIKSLHRFLYTLGDKPEPTQESRQSLNQDASTDSAHNPESEGRMQSGGDPGTKDLMVRVLKNIGCQPIKEDDQVRVKYQGEKFVMDFGGRYVRIWDLGWSGIKTDDPEFPMIQKAVNKANYSFGPTVVLTDPDDDGVIYFHSRRDIMLHPAVPEEELNMFVTSVLDSFFEIKQRVSQQFKQLNTEQAEIHKSRRPVGFATDEQESREQELKDPEFAQPNDQPA